MNLAEFRNQMESDATIENERLKRDIADLEKKYNDMCKAYSEKAQGLNEDCRALANRCFVLTQGSMCCFCELRKFRCPHAWSYDRKIKAAMSFMEE
jgi:hypothetical protein